MTDTVGNTASSGSKRSHADGTEHSTSQEDENGGDLALGATVTNFDSDDDNSCSPEDTPDVHDDDDDDDDNDDAYGGAAADTSADADNIGVMLEDPVDQLCGGADGDDEDGTNDASLAEEKPQQRRQRPSFARMRQESVRLGSQVKRQSLLAMRNPTVKQHVWFNVTRLVITPAVVCGILIGLDCGTSLFDTIPHLAKLVIIVNSSVPPAMLVILSLKSEGMSESAAVVSKLFTSSYLLSVISIAGWAAMGLMLSLPDDDGRYFCERI